MRSLAVLSPPARPLVEDMSPCGSLSVNPYAACAMRCAYCSTGAQGASTPRVPLTQVREQLRAELAQKGHLHHAISLGSLCDAYPPVEADLGVTRAVLEELTALGRPVVAITKGLTVARDADLLADGDLHRVTVSISSLDEAALARLEPGAASPSDRLDLVHHLVAEGVRVEVSLAPWIPGVSDVSTLVDRIDPAVPIVVAPLDVTFAEVARTGYGRRFDQGEIDAAYLAARDRTGARPNVRWLHPVEDRHEEACHPFRPLEGGRFHAWRVTDADARDHPVGRA